LNKLSQAGALPRVFRETLMRPPAKAVRGQTSFKAWCQANDGHAMLAEW